MGRGHDHCDGGHVAAHVASWHKPPHSLTTSPVATLKKNKGPSTELLQSTATRPLQAATSTQSEPPERSFAFSSKKDEEEHAAKNTNPQSLRMPALYRAFVSADSPTTL
jgi:hypothetical protein